MPCGASSFFSQRVRHPHSVHQTKSKAIYALMIKSDIVTPRCPKEDGQYSYNKKLEYFWLVLETKYLIIFTVQNVFVVSILSVRRLFSCKCLNVQIFKVYQLLKWKENKKTCQNANYFWWPMFVKLAAYLTTTAANAFDVHSEVAQGKSWSGLWRPHGPRLWSGRDARRRGFDSRTGRMFMQVHKHVSYHKDVSVLFVYYIHTIKALKLKLACQY